MSEQLIMHVYTDGSCQNNGSPHARAGYAVYFGENDARNEYNVVQGKQSNNTGELTAVIRALEIVATDIERDILVNIHTDSEYVIKCITTYGDKLAANNWKTSTKKDPPNKELLQKVHTLYNNYKARVKVHHIKAHTDHQDIHSIGNAEADRLANLAIGVNNLEKNKPNKYFIDVPYNLKDRAKELGARWDQKVKKWYYTDDLDDMNKMHLKNFEELYCKVQQNANTEDKEDDKSIEDKKHTECKEHKNDSKKIYIRIPFQSKNAAKNLGARWDPNIKSWYYFDNLTQDKIDKLRKLEQ
ncbi:RNase H family protein [Flavobacterium sp.]|jgi:ribonuclease HI|uniref:RNase H family protein n=1 Tax=Flavobacterium sp. TaxID=239 RepID=UPI0037C0220D